MKRALVILALGCGGSKDTPTNDDCTAYGQRTAELMYVGFERGSQGQGKWIKTELEAAVAKPMATYCRDKLPADHAQLVK